MGTSLVSNSSKAKICSEKRYLDITIFKNEIRALSKFSAFLSPRGRDAVGVKKRLFI